MVGAFPKHRPKKSEIDKTLEQLDSILKGQDISKVTSATLNDEEEEEANPVDPIVIPTNESLQEKKKWKKSWFWKSKETKLTKTVRRISTIIRIKTDKIELMTPSCATKYSKKR